MNALRRTILTYALQAFDCFISRWNDVLSLVRHDIEFTG